MDDDEIEALIEQEVDESTSSPKKDDESDGEKKKERKYRKKERVEEDASDEDAVVEGPELPPSMKSAKRGGGSRDRRGGRGASRSRSGSRDRRGGRGERDRDRDRRRGDRERERDRRRSRSRSGGDRRRSRSREDDRRRRRQSEREEREREERRKREKRLAKEREEYRRRQEKKRREREREEEKERERRRKERAKREKKEEEKRKKEALAQEEERRRRREEQGPTLTDILLENPGLSMQAALQKLAEVTARRAAEKAAQAGMSMLGLAGLGSLAVPGAGPNPANVLQNKALTKPYRDIYIGNLPEGTTGPQLQEALCALLAQMGLVNGPGEPITSTWVSGDGHYAFCEFRTIEEANNATKLNGIVLGTSTIKVGRPKNYAGPANPDSATVAALLNGQPIPASAAAAPPAPPDPVALAQQLAAQTNPTVPGAGAGAPPPAAAAVPVPPGVTAGSAANLLGGLAGFAGAPAPAVPMPGLLMGGGGAKPEDGLLAAQKAAAAMVPGMTPAMAVAAAQSAPDSRVIMLTNLPEACDASQVEELVKPFGTVTRFNLLTDHEGRSKGTAVFEYEDIGACELAMKGLKDLPIGDKRLAAQTVPTAMAETLLKKVEVTAADLRPVKETRVISLTNMVTAEELADDQEFEDIKEDVADECNKFGTVKSIEIPRPMPGGSGVAVPGLGRIFVEFADTVGANKARKSLAGRTFGGKKVEATYFPEDLYERKVFDENMAAVTSNDDNNNIVEEKSQDNEGVGEDNGQKIEEDETNGGQQPPPPPSGAAVDDGGAPSPPPLPQDEDDMD